MESLAAPGIAFAQASDPPKITEAALRNTALGAAFAMKPAGEIQAARDCARGTGEQAVTSRSGTCATFVAQGGLGTIEVDAFF
jgi:hypothetical protein